MRLAKYILPVVFVVLGCGLNSAGRLPKALLWRLEGPGIQPSYLFGTIHIMPRSQFEIGEAVGEAFKASDQLVMELDMDDINIQSEVLKYAAMKDGQSLSSMISPEDYAMIEEVVRETLGLGLATFDRFKPFVISTFLISRYIDGAPASFELTLAQMAEDQGLAINGLETIAEQMSVFDRIPYDVQAQELVQMVREEDQFKADYDQLLDMYHDQDLQGMYDIMVQHMTSEHQVNELLYKRNELWVPQIRDLAAEHPTFFAVGAAHLAGDKGLIVLLKEAGFKVTPVRR